MNYYLAIDIGASGGRHILGHLDNGKLVTEELFRFENSIKKEGGLSVWDIDALFENVLEGMRQCARCGHVPTAVGIDTWGVDYVLLDESGERIGPAVSYRDQRTNGMDESVERIIDFETIYGKTGIQKQPFNTVYQLTAVLKNNPEYLKRAESLLMIPDYLAYLLTGIRVCEYTNATTTGLVNAQTKEWDWEITDRLGFPGRIFGRISPPGTRIGGLTDEIRAAVGFNTEVYMTASHDTASAIVAIPRVSGEALYISSGTWSLMGTESGVPICNEAARRCNMTNEGGYEYRYRFLKNIMGMWMIQNVRSELCPETDYRDISEAAAHAHIDSTIDVNDSAFLSPERMTDAIDDYLRRTGQQLPTDIGQYARVIYQSLAKCYKKVLDEIEGITGKKYEVLNIVGGGSQAEFLNRQTAREINRPVITGPTEGTAIGNLTVLMIANGEISDLSEGRSIIGRSVQMKEYRP